MAMLSALLEQCVSRESCFTGEIDPLGNVLPVGGLETKITAAKECGIKTIYVPKANCTELKKISIKGIKVIPSEHIKEIMNCEFCNLLELESKERVR